MAEPWDWASVRWGSASVAAEVGVVPLWGEGWGVPQGLWGQFLCFMGPEPSGGK